MYHEENQPRRFADGAFSFEKKEDTDHMDMQEQLRKIQEEATSQLESIRDKAGLDALRLKTLGKKGDLTLMLRSMGQLPAEERPKAGQMINVVREKLTEQMDALDAKIKRIEQEKANAKRST